MLAGRISSLESLSEIVRSKTASFYSSSPTSFDNHGDPSSTTAQGPLLVETKYDGERI